MEIETDDIEINKIRKRIRFINVFAWIFVALGLVIFCAGINLWYNEHEKLNEIGDFVGGIGGSLWALSGLFFIYIAFLGQRIEIKYQQQDLKLTRDELKDTKEVFKHQSQIMSKQQLDNTFFNLLDNHRKLIDSFKKGETKYNKNLRLGNDYNFEIVSGYEILENKVINWKNIFKAHSICFLSKKVFDYSTPSNNPLEIIENDKDVKLLYSDITGIMSFIDEKMSENDKEFYIKILRNNLSFEERFLVEVYN